MKADEPWFVDEFDTVGLCRRCAHARIVASARGSTFFLCRLSETDARFPKYPQLPVMKCSGYVMESGAGEQRQS